MTISPPPSATPVPSEGTSQPNEEKLLQVSRDMIPPSGQSGSGGWVQGFKNWFIRAGVRIAITNQGELHEKALQAAGADRERINEAIERMAHAMPETSSAKDRVDEATCKILLEQLYLNLHTSFSRITGHDQVEALLGTFDLVHTFFEPSSLAPPSPSEGQVQASSTMEEQLSATMMQICFPRRADSLECVRPFLRNAAYSLIQGKARSLSQGIIARLVSKQVEDFLVLNIMDAFHSALGTGLGVPGPGVMKALLVDSLHGIVDEHPTTELSESDERELKATLDQRIDIMVQDILTTLSFPPDLQEGLERLSPKIKKKLTDSLFDFVTRINFVKLINNAFVQTAATYATPSGSTPGKPVPSLRP